MKENKFNSSVEYHLNLKVTIIILFILTIMLVTNSNSYSQDKTAITEDEKKEIITLLCERIERRYISEDIALRVSASIREKLEKNEYSKHDTPQKFVDQLDKDLQEKSKDKHLGITYNPKRAKEIKEQEKVNEILNY
jgi:signal recognition particle GTPase